MNGLFRTALWSTLVAASLIPSRSYAQDGAERVRFETSDGVEITGTFYPGNKKSPTVVLLHKMGGKSNTEGFKTTASELQKNGFAVLTFDWRGHGGSTGVSTDFWSRQFKHNTPGLGLRVRGFNPQQPPRSISFKDFTVAYHPYLINDLVAAKTYLERRNDNNDCNVSNLILLAEEDATVLAAMWAASESFRFRFTVAGLFQPPQPEKKPQSKDIVALIWISPTAKLGGKNYGQQFVLWSKLTGRDQGIPTAVVYGEKDDQATKTSEGILKVIQGSRKKEELKATGPWEVKKTDLAGAKLLSVDELGGRKWVVEDYLNKSIKQDHAVNVHEKRDADEDGFWWSFPGVTRLPLVRKKPGERVVGPAPVNVMVQHLNLRLDTP